MPDGVVETDRRDGVLRVARSGTRWLSTGGTDGPRTADAAYNLTVPEGFDRTDLDGYVADRLDGVGFDPGPALLTGVDQRHARGARSGPVAVVATAGLSNPATLPMDPDGEEGGHREPPRAGTVNLLVVTTRALAGDGTGGQGRLASLLATVVEARTATLLAESGFTGTTSDAVVVGCDPTGEPARFAGSATALGAATRACVREAVRASLASRYPDGDLPRSVEGAQHGTATEREATVFEIG